MLDHQVHDGDGQLVNKVAAVHVPEVKDASYVVAIVPIRLHEHIEVIEVTVVYALEKKKEKRDPYTLMYSVNNPFSDGATCSHMQPVSRSSCGYVSRTTPPTTQRCGFLSPIQRKLSLKVVFNDNACLFGQILSVIFTNHPHPLSRPEASLKSSAKERGFQISCRAFRQRGSHVHFITH